MEEKTITTILFAIFIIPACIIGFLIIKKRLSKWYYRGMRLATGYYTNKRVMDNTTRREYIQYDNSLSRWLHTYIFPAVFKLLLVIAILFIFCVRIPSRNGYILRTSDATVSESAAILDTKSFSVKTGKLAITEHGYLLDGNAVNGIVLGEYVEKNITIYTFPGVVVRSVVASVHSLSNKLVELTEKLY